MMTNRKSLLTPSRLRSALVAATVVLSVIASAQKVTATTITPVTLGTATTYGLIIGSSTGSGSSQNININGNITVNGNVAIGNYANIAVNGSNNNVYSAAGSGSSANDKIDYGPNATGSGSVNTCQCVLTTNVNLTNVMNDAVTASTAATNAYTDGSQKLSVSGNAIGLSSGNQAITALSSGENVLDISSLSLTGNATLTLNANGISGAKFIINVTGNLTESGTAAIKLAGGATAADVLFNVTGTGAAISLTTSGATVGTILAPAANVTLGGGGTLTGNLIQGFENAGKSYTVTEQSSGFTLSQLAYKPSTVTKTPEPSTIAIFGAGIIGLATARRWRRGSIGA